MWEVISAIDLSCNDPHAIAEEDETSTYIEISGMGVEGQSTKAKPDEQIIQFKDSEQQQSWMEIINHTVSVACRREKSSALRYALAVDLTKRKSWNPFSKKILD